jgi:lipopolysaccharide/colanic/teichoic acid biosynthesis glycosyltransferase
MNQVQVACDHVEDPDRSLEPYDILLTSSVSDLSPDWATAITKAMLMGKPVRLLAEFVEEDRGLVSLEHFDLEHLPEAGLTSYQTRKRLMDICLVVLAVPVALPLLLMGAAVVLITMGRPVLFMQSRAGLGGQAFRMYKLRTMHVSAETGVTRATVARDDFRITAAGRWLRRFRIDELPQLWNVMIGDMSVIGPRPEWTPLSDRYIEQLPVYAYRHLVRPGITGWAQVRGGYAADLEETRAKVGYDLFYIKNLSFSLDLQILIRTIGTLLTGSGAR